MSSQVELWKKYPDIEEIEVSSFGRIRSVKGHYYTNCPSDCGYLKANIPVGGKWNTKRVHRLVAQVFIPNPNNLPQVNHKDGDRTNNNVDNLEWCTASYNIQYREKFGESLGHPVFAINLSTLEVSRFRSQREAERTLGVSQGNVSDVIKGELEQTDGYWFVNADEHALDIVKQNLHDIGKTGLNIKLRV